MTDDGRPLILVADDEPDLRLLCRINLESEGYRMAEAADGRQTVDLARRERPAAIVMDAMMPMLDGYEVLAQLKADPELARIPVVMLTAKVEQSEQIRTSEAGAAAFVTKPFRPQTLIEVVRQLVPTTSVR